MGKIYKFDIGTRLRTTLSVDLAGYSSIDYKIKKPSGNTLTKTCTIEDQANGIVYYDTIDGDLDEIGTYLIQVQVVFTGGNQNESETQNFEVYDSFD